MSKELKALYTYLCDYVPNKDIKQFIIYLQEFINNGSFVDFLEAYDTEDIRELIEDIYATINKWRLKYLRYFNKEKDIV